MAAAREAGLRDRLPLLRAHCDLHAVAPADAALLARCRALLAGPERGRLQLLARRSRRLDYSLPVDSGRDR